MVSRMIRYVFRNIVYTFVLFANRLFLWLGERIGQRHQLVLPFATYAPWLDDQEFLSLYEEIEDDCLVSLFQCWELWTLSQQMGKRDGDVLEVGVWRGGSSVILGRALMRCNSQAKLFCCDGFRGLSNVTSEDPYNWEGELSDSSVEAVEKRFATHRVEHYQILEGIFPADTGRQISEHRFSLCHIDVDTRRSAEDVLEWVWPRLVVGGVIVFQDYGFHRTPGITALVDSLRGKANMNIIHNLNGNALIFKTS